ncbi:hypothetical protein [Chitinophaga sp. 212800008-4]|uniref:hypothetical protein n=1 Tax=unclassified Chitinophaga TaxID=2619133 RepID=UPI0030CB330C
MKYHYLLLCLLLGISGLRASAQAPDNAGTRAKAAAVFTKLLNDAAAAYPPRLSYLTEAGARIESPFRVTEEGILSVTFRYQVDNSFTLYRVSAPVSAIKEVFCDDYLGLEFTAPVVKIAESEKGSRELVESNTLALFHIAKPGEGPTGERLKQRVEQALQVFREGITN